MVRLVETVVDRVPHLTHLTLPTLWGWTTALPAVMRRLGELTKLRSLHARCSFSRDVLHPNTSLPAEVVQVGGKSVIAAIGSEFEERLALLRPVLANGKLEVSELREQNEQHNPHSSTSTSMRTWSGLTTSCWRSSRSARYSFELPKLCYSQHYELSIQKLKYIEGTFNYSESKQEHRKLCNLLDNRNKPEGEESLLSGPSTNEQKLPSVLCVGPKKHSRGADEGVKRMRMESPPAESPWIQFHTKCDLIGDVRREILREAMTAGDEMGDYIVIPFRRCF